MSFRTEIVGMDDFTRGMQSVMKALTPPNLADSLAAGGEVILHGVQENILEQELYKTGNLYDSVKVRKVNQYAVDILVDCEYGAVHEYGYTGVITPKQRAFFWAKYSETSDTMWKALALSTSYTIPARPYVRPAVDEKMDEARLAVAQEMTRKLMAAL